MQVQSITSPDSISLPERRTDIEQEAIERPRWCAEHLWQSAKEEARGLGYTGRDVYRQAADLLSIRYGY